MGLTAERLTMLGQQAHAIMLISILLLFLCFVIVIRVNFSLGVPEGQQEKPKGSSLQNGNRGLTGNIQTP